MKITLFRGEFEYLSNSFPSLLLVEGELYATVEHAYQAAKTDDPAVKAEIMKAADAHDAKKIGRKVKLVSDWESKKLDVMASLVQQKFQNHIDLKLKLLLTGKNELVQGETHYDTFWGVNKQEAGDNNLGLILMRIREKILNQEGDFFQILKTYLENQGLGFVNTILENSVGLNKQYLDLDIQSIAVTIDEDTSEAFKKIIELDVRVKEFLKSIQG